MYGHAVLYILVTVFNSLNYEACVLDRTLWTIVVVHSRDDKGVGMAHQIKLLENQPDDNGAVVVR